MRHKIQYAGKINIFFRPWILRKYETKNKHKIYNHVVAKDFGKI